MKLSYFPNLLIFFLFSHLSCAQEENLPKMRKSAVANEIVYKIISDFN